MRGMRASTERGAWLGQNENQPYSFGEMMEKGEEEKGASKLQANRWQQTTKRTLVLC